MACNILRTMSTKNYSSSKKLVFTFTAKKRYSLLQQKIFLPE